MTWFPQIYALLCRILSRQTFTCFLKSLSKQEHKVSYICSLPSPLQRRSKDYKGLGGSAIFKLLSFLWLWQEVYQLSEKFCAKVAKNSEAKNLQNLKSHIMCEVTRLHRGSFRVKYGKNSSHFKNFTPTPLVALATNIKYGCLLTLIKIW